jgi:hypothetical protein
VRNLKYLALSLLGQEVAFPADDPADPDGPPIERMKTMQHVLTKQIPGVLFDGEDEAMMRKYFGKEWKASRRDYETLCQALISMKRTGKIDRATVINGQQSIDIVIAGMKQIEESALANLRPDDDLLNVVAQLSTRYDHKEAISRQMGDRYFSYLCFRCSRDALEILRERLGEINQLLDAGPGVPPR